MSFEQAGPKECSYVERMSQDPARDFCPTHSYATFGILMAPSQPAAPEPDSRPSVLYCPQCAREVTDPLTCGDCAAVICRVCGSPLESPDELGIG
jgi:hypothetical protein